MKTKNFTINTLLVLLLSLVVSCNKLPDEELFDGPVAVEAIKNEAVDLGLPSGIKWATCNVGAKRPWDYGGFYAWGEVEEKSDYDWDTYRWCDGNYNTLTKYCTDSNYGTVDYKTTLDPEDDAANFHLGGDWRMPTIAEFKELRDNCKWTWMTENGVNGYVVTGSNGNSIFLPAGGNRYDTSDSRSGIFGYYWSSSLYGGQCSNAHYLYFHDSTYDKSLGYRCEGRTVRPVWGERLVAEYTVSVTSAGNGSVLIKDNSETSCTIKEGVAVTVMAKPDDGYAFDGWYVDGEDTPISVNSVYTFTVCEDVVFEARFATVVCEAVDLGLPSGVKWATCNVGALRPEQYGCYYAWGETEEKEDYDWYTYKWCYGSEYKYGDTGKTVLDPEDDVAHVRWGAGWRMPTNKEMDELCGMCTWQWTAVNGVDGYQVTGPNENSVFIPAAGRWKGTTFDPDDLGNYWTASLHGSTDHGVYLLFFSGYFGCLDDLCCYGYTVRPVYVEKYSVSVASAGNGSVAIKDKDGTSAAIEHGSTVTVVATPDEGYAFDGWYVDGDETPASTDAEYTFTVCEDVALMARFVPIVYEAVDLGLPSGVKWATFNVGASKPEEYGGYYAWGETEEKSIYDWSTYKWCNGSSTTMTKYCTNSGWGTVDNKTLLDLEDDVAHVRWGGDWRMPTRAEVDELRVNCTWNWVTLNGVNGYEVTGTNGNSIFLPAAGYYDFSGNNRIGSEGYYSSNLLDNSNGVSIWYFGSRYSGSRYIGSSVRPVCGEYVAPVAKYTVAVSCEGGGCVAIVGNSDALATFEDGSNVTVVATPYDDYVFKGWFVNENETPVSTDAEYTFTVNENITLTARFVYTYLPTGSVNGHEYVDLGLPSGIKWATCNVGATSPEEYGGYYAWGETEEKDDYSWSTYKWCNGSETSMTKYCNHSEYGTIDNKTTLESEDDVAHVKWGGEWRMPTFDEQKELLRNCTWTWTTQNGVNGYKVTSKSNGNSIFLPAAGFRYGTATYYRGSYGYYWSLLLYSDGSYAYDLYFDSGSYVWDSGRRFRGQSVRPVCD